MYPWYISRLIYTKMGLIKNRIPSKVLRNSFGYAELSLLKLAPGWHRDDNLAPNILA